MSNRVFPLNPGLLGNFVFLALLTAVAGALGIFFTWSVSLEIDVVSSKNAQAVSALSDIARHTHQMVDESRRTLEFSRSAANPDIIAQWVRQALLEFELANSRLERSTATFASLSLASPGPEYPEEFEQGRAHIYETGREVIERAASPGTNADLDDSIRALNEAEEQMQESIHSALTAELNHIRLAQGRADRLLMQASILTLTVVVLAIILSVVLGRSKSLFLASQVGRFHQAATQLRAGNLKVRVAGAGGGFGGLATSFNAMAEHIEKEHQRSTQTNRELMSEIEYRRKVEQQLRHDAMHDPLTGLSNRARLIDHINLCIERCKRDSNYRFALLFIDLDRFKLINDSLGHKVGDEVLMDAAGRLLDSVRGLDSVVRIHDETTARLGGDEFAILLDGIANPGRAVLIAERIQKGLTEPFLLGTTEMRLGVSIGIAVSDERHKSAEDIIQDADTAMYRAKVAGGNHHAVFDEAMHADVKSRLQLENDLRRAVEEQQFEMRYQPIVSLHTNEVVAFEALVRWNNPVRGIVGPDEFISVTEETGLIVQIGRTTMLEACRQLAAWRSHLASDRELSISVNISALQIRDGELVRDIEHVLEQTGVDPRWLRLEITESVIMDHTELANRVISGLKNLGVELHLDDFGTGYSSLSCLHRFPIDVLKIDRSFVATMDNDPQYASVVRAIMSLAKNLKMRVTAEGLENARQLALVRALGCDYGQGFLFSPPLAPAEAWALISRTDVFRQTA